MAKTALGGLSSMSTFNMYARVIVSHKLLLQYIDY